MFYSYREERNASDEWNRLKKSDIHFQTATAKCTHQSTVEHARMKDVASLNKPLRKPLSSHVQTDTASKSVWWSFGLVNAAEIAPSRKTTFFRLIAECREILGMSRAKTRFSGSEERNMESLFLLVTSKEQS